ncbi:serine/threonine-protein kinase MRCK beta-like [Centruroides sculpturatus]|uniref:serine/threonine-protein kinase MRCK beta-like n=1 Tax=Centruroides sculpturatus TaxID=218467 RepID=UPI000C6CCFA4|nr:serine/threonine-protein kinase MRCK beta-like [Centruroides sculpturatus]
MSLRLIVHLVVDCPECGETCSFITEYFTIRLLSSPSSDGMLSCVIWTGVWGKLKIGGGRKLLELRAQKQKLSRQVRDKEEELENSLQKIDTLRQDLRKADKLRRELEARIEDAKSDIAKERRMKERSDEYARHLEEEMESLKQRHVGWGTSPAQLEATQEINRLKLEIESVELQHKEILTQQQSRYNAEMTNLLDQLQETECTKETLEKEIMTLKEKIEQTRTDR